MKHILCLFMAIIWSIPTVMSQIDAYMMQHPDISENHVAFSYGDDIWIASRSEGTAHRLSTPAGVEMFPKFSPDGSHLAYSANYNGNIDVFVIPVTGGIPTRLTYHGMADIVLGWTPDGNSILFSSPRYSGRQRYPQFYTVSIEGGEPQKLPIPYGFFADYSPEGNQIAFTDLSRVNRNWKRYRGGMAPDIHLFNLDDFSTQNITNNSSNDELPMWLSTGLFYMSDRGPNQRNNIWKYDPASGSHTQMTDFENYDITFPSAGKRDIIFEAGGNLHTLNTSNGDIAQLNITLVSDQRSLIPKTVKVEKYIQSGNISPDGNRLVIMARGDVFSVPAKEGFVSNLTQTPGAAERYPACSPDGKSIAFWSDRTGEYQLNIYNTENSTTRSLTNFESGFYYNIYWAPDSKSIAFVDQAMNISIINVTNGARTVIDKGKYMFEGNLRGFSVSWSPDSRYLTYSKGTDSRVTNAVFVYDTQSKRLSKVTSGFYTDTSPVFSHDGNYIFFATNRTFQPVYSDLDNTFIYPNSTTIAAVPVNTNIASILPVKNDEESSDKNDSQAKEEEKDDKAKSNKRGKKNNEKDAKPTDPKTVVLDLEGFESRAELLPIEPGNIGQLSSIEGKLIFTRFPNSGSGSGSSPSIRYFDFESREEKDLISGASNFMLSADGKKLAVSSKGKFYVVKAAPGQKLEKAAPTSDMQTNVIPKDEWRQIFRDVWRIERDYFYDPNLHGVDWNAMKDRYGSLVEQANSRNDVNIIIGDLIAELNASHTYNGGGDQESAPRMNVGYLGADFEPSNGFFKITSIIKGAEWDAEVRSPLDKPGLEVSEGDFIIAINGVKAESNKPMAAYLQGMANKTVQLTINNSPNMTNAKNIMVKTLGSETRLRHLAWINSNRKRVEEATEGRVGYIYVRSTGVDGQNELVRQFYGQMGKEALIIDERFNSGGQIPDRFIELLDRDPLAFWAVRDGRDWAWPPAGHFGPKVMLINGFSGSGGDAFPDYFRKREIGPLIGTRTWGGLIGVSGAPTLIDNGNVTVPTFRMYDPDGEWFKEGHGVDPDIEIKEDFHKLANGTDEQLEAGIREIIKLLNDPNRIKVPNRPSYEKR